jgi:hypothetical protein
VHACGCAQRDETRLLSFGVVSPAVSGHSRLAGTSCLIDLRHISLTLVQCCLIRMDFPGGGDAGTSRPMQVASLPTAAGRATLHVMMQASAAGAGASGLGQGSICPIGRVRCPDLPYRRPAAAGSVGGARR